MTALLFLLHLKLTAAVAAVAVALESGLFGTEFLDSPVIADTVSWGLLAGVFTPLLTAVVQRPGWSPRRRAVVGALMSVLIGVLTCLSTGDLDSGKTVLSTIAAVLVAAQTTYANLWKKTAVAPAIEAATSPKSGNLPPDNR